MKNRKAIILFILLSTAIAGSAQEIGANFNHDPEIIDLTYVKKTGVEWIRTTPYIFEYIRGEKNVDREPGLDKLIEASKSGYKIAFGFRWDFKRYDISIPAAGSEKEKEYFGVAMRILERVGPYIRIFKLGNEPNLETKEEDLQINKDGFVPLVRFTERLLSEVVEVYYAKHPELKRPDIYTGSLPRLFMKNEQKIPGVVGLIKMAQQDKRIKGLSIHLHVSDSLEMKECFRFVRSLMPEKPIIVPEFSLFRLYNKHVSDSLGDSDNGKAFAKKYSYPAGMKLYEWFSKANTQLVSAAEWNEMFGSRSWFPQHFMLTWYRHFQQHDVVLATYGYFSQAAPKQMGPNSPTWFVNPIYAYKSLQPHADGSHMENPLWYKDFVSIVEAGKIEKPNIVIIYVDDLGYGDLACYGATSVKTPNVDWLAGNGLRFTDAHCTAATCTPSRLSLLTGQYGFRNNAAVLPGDAALLIKPGTETLPAILQKAGYATAVVGKWHLGLGNGNIDWNGNIAPGPNETGFDYSFIIPATTDRVPTVYVENGRVPHLDAGDPIHVSYGKMIGDEPTGLSHPALLKMRADTQHSNTIVNGISRIGYMAGGKAARWVDEDIADVLTAKAKTFITDNKDKRFFLFFSIPDIHVPRAPHRRFVGSTSMGKRGDVITEMDWMTGEITALIEKLGLKEKTIIIFSSDNGPVLDDGYMDEAVEKKGSHDPSGGFRGGKYSAFEAGTRVPFIACWPGRIGAGKSDALFSQIDLLATLATLCGQESSAADSRDMLPTLMGHDRHGREYLVEESYTLALRKAEWKYIAPVEKAAPAWFKNKKIESGLMQEDQLYNIKNDPGEKNNLAKKYPAIVAQLKSELQNIKRKP